MNKVVKTLEPLLKYKFVASDNTETFARHNGTGWLLNEVQTTPEWLRIQINQWAAAKGQCVLAWHCFGKDCFTHAARQAMQRVTADGGQVTSGLCRPCLIQTYKNNGMELPEKLR